MNSNDDVIPYPLSAQNDPLTARKHGPRGYRDYRSFKPWLRDEHSYRCVYCLLRETWFHESADFGVDHVNPQSIHPELATQYENLAYACNNCNRRKQAMIADSDLVEIPLAAHLRFRKDGRAVATSATGAILIEQLHLNLLEHVEIRRHILQFWEHLRSGNLNDPKVAQIARLFEYPPNLDDLRMLRPAGGNTRPDGLDQCGFVLREQGLLPRFVSV